MKRTLLMTFALCLVPVIASAQTDVQKRANATRAEVQKMLGFVPAFIKVIPDAAVPGLWEEMKGLQISTNTALPCKIKELIGLAVAAQIPCEYCIVAHTEFAKLGGATDQEIGEAIALGGLTRHWSTFFNGVALDETAFRSDVQRLVLNIRKSIESKAAPPKPIEVVDAPSARKEIELSFGFVPEFMRIFPDEALSGAWKQLRDVEMSPATALSSKYKSLIGLGVAAQVPCRYCVIADTEFSKLDGASDREIREAVAMAALTRDMSTVMNGLQVDKATNKKDVLRVVETIKKQQAQHAAR
jgi:AhpD family alkylhydroperoxidase